MTTVILRRGGPADIEPAILVWREANARRKDGQPVSSAHEKRVRSFVRKPDAFLIVADTSGEVIGVALGMQGLARDGVGAPVDGLCHISMIFVAPEYWGEGIGGQLVDTMLEEAHSRGYSKVQLWTQDDNPRAQWLYEGRGFTHTGRQKRDDELGELIMHYTRPL